jgi:hypothetical protein
MKTKFASWLFILLFLTACSQSGSQATEAPKPQQNPPTSTIESSSTVEILSTVTPACISQDPSQTDIDRALSFTEQVFEQDDWEQTYTVSEDRVSVSWFSNSLGAVAFMEALIFPCGYEEPDLNNYFNDENWDNVFANYESYELVTECRSDAAGLRLYQFDVDSDGVPYLVNYWVKNDTNNRVVSFMMIVPDDSFDLLDEYSYSLFPQLSNCS